MPRHRVVGLRLVYDTAVQLHNIVRHAHPARGTPSVGNVVGSTRAGIPRLMDGQKRRRAGAVSPKHDRLAAIVGRSRRGDRHRHSAPETDRITS